MKDEHPRRAARGANLRRTGADVKRRRILDHDLRAHDVIARRLHRAPGKFLQPRVAAQLDERPIAIIGVGSQREDPPRRAVEQNHLAARARYDHCLGHAAQNRLELVALLGQRVDVGDDRVGGVEQMMLRAAHRVASFGQHMRRRTPLLQRGRERVEPLGATRQRSSDRASGNRAEPKPEQDYNDDPDWRCRAGGGEHHQEYRRGRETDSYRCEKPGSR